MSDTASRFVVSADWLQQRLTDPAIRILDASFYLPAHKRDADAEYAAGHIPGAIRFDQDKIADHSTPLPHMVPTPEAFAAMVDDVAGRLASFDGRDRLSHLLASPNFHLLGTSGTVTTLAGVHLDLERYDRRRVDGLWMDRHSVDRMIEKLIGWDFQQRVANPCIGTDRADLVLAGCAILQAIRDVWPSERLRVADRGLREGILSELMADDGVWRGNGRGRA